MARGFCVSGSIPAAAGGSGRYGSTDAVTEQKRAAVSVQPETETGTADSRSGRARGGHLQLRGDGGQMAAGVGRPQGLHPCRRRVPGAPLRAGHVPLPVRRPAHGPRRSVRHGRRRGALPAPEGLSTSCTRSAGTPSACPRRTPPSSATPTPASGPTPTSTPRRRPSSATPSRPTGPAGCTPRTRSTTAGPSGCSSASTSAAWRTARIPRSTGAPRTRRCWPTNR